MADVLSKAARDAIAAYKGDVTVIPAGAVTPLGYVWNADKCRLSKGQTQEQVRANYKRKNWRDNKRTA